MPGRPANILRLFPLTAGVDDGELRLGGLTARELLDAHGSPLVVYDEATVRAQARAYRAAAPDAFVCYGAKAFPNVALMRILAEEGIGADVSTAGEFRFAEAAGITGERLVVHGNNKSDEELGAAATAGSLVVVDSLEEVVRARETGVARTLIRVTPGIDADTHEAIRTAHHGSKFGLPPDDALEALRLAPETEGLHVHVGSQLLDSGAALMAVDWMATFAARARAELGWELRTIDLGGGLGVPTSLDDPQLDVEAFVPALLAELERACEQQDIPHPGVVLEPGRSLVGRAGVTLYRVGAVKETAAGRTWVAVDGGLSDNPRPALYGARYAALLANRADEPPHGTYAVAGKHCESGDVLIDRVELPEPRRGDILAVPATGGYTLAMGSNYNAVPRPAVVLVRDGNATVIRRRETIDDLLALESY
ncbi:MAG: diaminopimelate decarboxylase [Actinobacteria bacterium]|nr:diaminopimelate decarboxylase [Actinomycetota bacterium]MBV8599611.1 diaminopimelate decarboxylase [Actinomycetota bacterium]